MKRKLIYSSMLYTIFEIICLLTPGSFLKEHWRYFLSYPGSSIHYGSSIHVYDIGTNIFGAATGFGIMLAIIVLTTLILCFLGFLFHLQEKQNFLSEKYMIFPFISAVAIFAYAVFACNGRIETTNWWYGYSLGSIFYLIIILHIITLAVVIYIKVKNLGNNDDADLSTINDIPSAETSKKYRCPNCGNMVNYGTDKCIICNTIFDWTKI